MVDGDRKIIPIEKRKEVFYEYFEVIKLIEDLDLGIFTMNYADYLDLPEIIRLALNYWKKEKISDDNR